MRYQYKIINVEQQGNGRKWVAPSSEWKFVSMLGDDSMLFEKAVMDNQTFSLQDLESSATRALKEE